MGVHMQVEINDTSIPKRCPTYTLHAESDVYALVNMEGDKEYGLNGTAAAIWDLCSGRLSIREIAAVIAEQFPEVKTSIPKDVLTTVTNFRNAKTVFCTDVDGTNVSLHTEFPSGTMHSSDPIIVSFDNFLSPEECRHIIDAAGTSLERATVAANSKRTISDHRTNRLVHLKFDDDPILQSIGERAATLIGLSLSNCEPPQVLHYGIGEEYKPHGDAFDLDTENGRFFTKTGGQRLATLFIYLNTVESGGETSFPNLDITVQSIQGRAVLFYNCYRGTVVPDLRSLHHAHPIARGEKWAMPLWFRERKASQ